MVEVLATAGAVSEVMSPLPSTSDLASRLNSANP